MFGCQVAQILNDTLSGAVGDPCHVEAGVDFALGVRRARLQDLGFRRLCLQEADESGETHNLHWNLSLHFSHRCISKGY